MLANLESNLKIQKFPPISPNNFYIKNRLGKLVIVVVVAVLVARC